LTNELLMLNLVFEKLRSLWANFISGCLITPTVVAMIHQTEIQ